MDKKKIDSDIDLKNELVNMLAVETDDESKISVYTALLTGDYKYIFEDCAKDWMITGNNAVIKAHYLHDFCNCEAFEYFINIIEQTFIERLQDKAQIESFRKLIGFWVKRQNDIDKEYINTVSNNDPDNISLKYFPKNIIDKEKEILNSLAKNYHIKRDLSENGKYPLFIKTGTKRLIRALYEHSPDYKYFHAFNFINTNIETGLPIATLQNYCREVKKDMPNSKNV